MNVNLTVAETDRSINMTVSDDLHEISLDASQDSYEFEMDVDGEIDFDVASYSGAYLLRQLPYSSDAKSLRKIVGCSFAWNQIAALGNGISNGSSLSYNSTTKETTVTPTNYGSDAVGAYNLVVSTNAVVGHKYFVSINVNLDHSGSIRFGFGTGLKTFDNVNSGRYENLSNIQQFTASSMVVYLTARSSGWTDGTYKFKDVQCIDLTRLFGSTIADYIYALEQGTAGAGVAFFKNLFSKDYYPYDAGSIVSVKTSASTMVGVNLLDSTNIFQGNFDSYGQAYINNVVTGFIRVLPNTRYYERKRFQTSGCYVRLYKADKTTYTAINKYVSSDFDFTTAADTAYVRLMWYRNTGITRADVINADCCLNVYDASINGTYVPYVKSEYALSNTELRGIPKLDANNKLYYDGDEYTADGTVKRKYGIVDLGTLSWTKRNTSTGHWRFTTQDIPIKWNSASDAVGNMVCPRYQSVSASNTWNGITGISSHTTMTQLLVCDETYSDAATFKSAMSGVYLIYELATPTKESATAYTQAQKCYPNGTEEFVDGRTVEVPVWNEAKYIQ